MGQNRSHVDILAALRHAIQSGRWKPGDKLPGRAQLAASFQASRMTIQKAVFHLCAEGHLVAHDRRGTYVAERPPHLNHFALIYPQPRLRPQGWTRFFALLQSIAQNMRSRGEGEFTEYFGHDWALDEEEHRQLCADLDSGRLAGLIFTTGPFRFLQRNERFWEARGVPAAAFLSAAAPGLTCIWPDYASFFDQAVQRLVAAGRRRIALLQYGGGERDSSAFDQALQRHEAATRPFWKHNVLPEGARGAAELLMRLAENERPDGLILQDEHLHAEALAGLHAAGARPGDAVDVVCHCNYPSPSYTEATALGFDLEAGLRAAMAAICARRLRQTAPDFVPLPARFSEAAIESAAAGRAS